MIEITARAGSYRKGLLAAAAHLSPEEAAIIADLERHGLQVPQLHDVLCGGHVLVDDPELYEDWRFAKVSHLRVSSHHKDIDKARYPDIGMRGPGGPGETARPDGPGHLGAAGKDAGRLRPAQAAQPDRHPASHGLRGVPGDPQQRRPVGPVPADRAAADVPVPGPGRPYLAGAGGGGVDGPALRRIERDDDVTSASQDLAARFPPPDRPDPANELGEALPGRAGRGLFGNSDVWVTETPSRIAVAILDERTLEQSAGPAPLGQGGGHHERTAGATVPGEAAVPPRD